MVEAVRTAASTLGIWVIVAVAMIVLAAWLVGIYVADNYQTRLSRQRRRMGAPGPGLTDAGVSAASSIPGQRRDAGQPEPAPEPTPETAAARGRHARPADYYAAADYYGTADYKAAEKTPAGYPETRARGVGDAATGGQAADAPTRPDLPAQPGQPDLQGQPDVPAQPGQPDLQGRPDVPAQPGQPDVPGQAAQPSSGRHAMPAQRSGDSDRAERTYAGPDADHQDDDEDQR
jgi:hypothetical protein